MESSMGMARNGSLGMDGGGAEAEDEGVNNLTSLMADSQLLLSQIEVPDQVRSVIMEGPGHTRDSYMMYLRAIDQLRESVTFIERVLQNGKLLVSTAMDTLLGNFRVILSSSSLSPDPDELRAEMLADSAPEHIRPPEVLTEDALDRLRSIAKRLVDNGYGEACCKLYRECRGVALRRNFEAMKVSKLTKGEIHSMQWKELENHMKTWNEHMHIGMIYIAAEREACDSVFENVEPWREQCFVDLSQPSLLLLLGFGMAAAGIKHSPEKLFSFLDMYETATDLQPTVEDLFGGREGESARNEYSQLLRSLGGAARGTFDKFEQAVRAQPILDEPDEHGANPGLPSSSSMSLGLVRFDSLRSGGNLWSLIKKNRKRGSDTASEVPSSAAATASAAASATGNVHPLASYVVNYVIMMCNSDLPYFMNLEAVFRDPSTDPNANTISGRAALSVTRVQSRLAFATAKILEALKANLEARAAAMGDDVLGELFLMNNFIYILTKIGLSDAWRLLGEAWRGNYEEIADNHRDKFIENTLAKFDPVWTDSTLDTAAFVKRIRVFNSTFERLKQRGQSWCIPNADMRAHVKRAIIKRLLDKYTDFMSRYRHLLRTNKMLDEKILERAEIQKALDSAFQVPTPDKSSTQ